MPTSRSISAVAVAVAALVTAAGLAGCGESDAVAAGSSDDLRTDFGVDADSITLGVLTDRTGPFKDFSSSINAGHRIWADEVNTAGGLCGRQIKLDIRDHGYQATTAKVAFPAIEPDVVGFLQLLGSPVIAALAPDLTDRRVTASAVSFSSDILGSPYLLATGTTYDLQQINGLSYLLEQGAIAPGNRLGHVYLEGEYGGNGLRGSQYFAAQHDMTVIPKKVTPADADMVGIVTSLKGAGVSAIALSTTPPQTASVAAANEALRLDVPLLGNSPAFVPQLLTTPAAGALSRLVVAATTVPFSSDLPKAVEIADRYAALGSADPPNLGVQYGYALGEIWRTILTRACVDKDMTRTGIQAALQANETITTGGLLPDLDYSAPGSPPARQSYLAVPDSNEAGGLRQIRPLFSTPDAATYVAPHQER